MYKFPAVEKPWDWRLETWRMKSSSTSEATDAILTTFQCISLKISFVLARLHVKEAILTGSGPRPSLQPRLYYNSSMNVLEIPDFFGKFTYVFSAWVDRPAQMNDSRTSGGC